LNAHRLKRYFVLIVIIGLFITCLAGSSGQLVAQAALPGRQPVIDPFYLKVFEEAKMHFDRGDYKKAFENFKDRCFRTARRARPPWPGLRLSDRLCLSVRKSRRG